jgi:hypothetical protein
MSSQVQAEIYKTQQDINRLKQADDYNQAQANASWSMGDYGQGNFLNGLQNSPLSKQISEMNDYMNRLVNIQNATYDENQKLQALNQLKQTFANRNVDYYGSWGGVRRKKRSSRKNTRRTKKSRKTKKSKKRNTLRKK